MYADGNMVIPDRVRELRRRHGMTQENLAEHAGLSLAVIKKIEQGGTARMETYHQIARVLGVNTMMFVAPDSPEPTEQALDDVVLAEIRSVINPARGLSGDPVHRTGDSDEADLGRLRRALSAMATAYHTDRYDDLAGALPSLVRSVHHHVEFFDSGSDHREALRLRADITSLAGRYLIQIRAHDLALVALHASLRDAIEIGRLRARSTDRRCRRRHGRTARSRHDHVMLHDLRKEGPRTSFPQVRLYVRRRWLW